MRKSIDPMCSRRKAGSGQPWSPPPALISLDEFPVGYSWAGCSAAEPASASPTGEQCAVNSSCRSRIVHRTANSVLTGCLSPGGKLTTRGHLALLTYSRRRNCCATAVAPGRRMSGVCNPRRDYGSDYYDALSSPSLVRLRCGLRASARRTFCCRGWRPLIVGPRS